MKRVKASCSGGSEHKAKAKVSSDKDTNSPNAVAAQAGDGSGSAIQDRTEAERFLQLLDPTTIEFSYQTYDDNKERKDPKLARILHGTLDEHWTTLVDLNNCGAGIAVTPNKTNLKGRTAKDIIGTRAQFGDLDGGGMSLDLIKNWSLAPHIIVETSPNHFHPYWLSEGVELDDFSPIQKALADAIQGDPSVADLPHAMRLPGFLHRKGEPHLVRIIHTHDALRYKTRDFPKLEQHTKKQTSSDGSADENRVACACAIIPNDYPARADWVRVNAAIYSATDGSEFGNKVCHAWSRKWSGYNEKHTEDLWQSFHASPPTQIGAGTLFHLANEARPGWEDDLDAPDVAALIAAFQAVMGGDAWVAPQINKPEQDAANGEQPKATKRRLMQSSAEFVAGYVPPDYLIDGLLQRRFVYSLTAPTGSGKTCVALRLAGHVALGVPLAGREIVKGRVLFFAGENPDDVRARWIKLCEDMQQDPIAMDVFFLPGTPPIASDEIREMIDAEAAEHGPFSLVIVDTSAAYFQGDDENNNVQLGGHARMLRTLVNLPGGPTIIVTCHPIKNADMSNLLPRGGGAFLAEMDGNLVCLHEYGSTIVEIDTHGKFRGPEFAPFAFKLVACTSEKLKDTKGRLICTVIVTPITDDEKVAIEDAGQAKQEILLRAVQKAPASSMTELAKALGWQYQNGDPNKSLVQRLLKQLVKDKLIEMKGKRPVVTAKGDKHIAAQAAEPL